MLTEDYKVRLDTFEGPLDLLLFLIRKSEVDIHDIPVGMVAEQYMSFLSHIDRVDIDVAGEFLVMAATLTEIKSRMLSPAPASPDEPEAKAASDPRAELVKQLLAYKKYRDAANALEHRFEDWRARFPAGSVLPDAKDASVKAVRQALIDAAADLEIQDLEIVDLVEAFRKVMDSVNMDRLGDHQVTYDDTPIEVHATDIVDFLKREAASLGTAIGQPIHEVEFTSVFKGRTHSQMVGLFLAVLTLVRDRRVTVRQDKIDAQIYLALEPEAAQ